MPRVLKHTTTISKSETSSELLKVIKKEGTVSQEAVSDFIASYLELKENYDTLQSTLVRYNQNLVQYKKAKTEAGN